jgi:CRP/FNR family transcriptional regulator, cyclic AMP receptor protein
LAACGVRRVAESGKVAVASMLSKQIRPFDVRLFLNSAGVKTKSGKYQRTEGIFSQGDVSDTVMYIQKGSVKLTVRSKTGREVIVAVLGRGDFFGEGCLSRQPRRIGNATAMSSSTIVAIKKNEMFRLLHEQPALADRFITYLLGAGIRIEEDLVKQLFNHDEKRLARALLLLARYGGHDKPDTVLPRISRTKLASLAGTTRSRVGFFMEKFKRLGFVETGRALKINSSLLSVVLHE